MAELHVSGQITDATGFAGANLFCEWGIATGPSWEVLQGFEHGRTQVDSASGSAVWIHPLDIHLASQGLASWPKLHFQVWQRQKAGRAKIRGYGFCHVPTTPGMHRLSCSTWVPKESFSDQLFERVAGTATQLKYENIVHSPEDRFRLQTCSSGVINLELNIVARNFARHHVLLS